MGKNISDADRKMAKKMLSEDSRTISDADRRMLKKMLSEGSRTISDADKALADEMFIKRNDGGIARKTRTF